MHALLLHMHQPDYRDPATGEPTMPWVRLHATRGYFDVPSLIIKHDARATVNLVPSLIDQWEHYARGGKDPHLRLCERPADSLEPFEIDWMLEHFFHGAPVSFMWFEAWGELRARRDARERFSAAQLRDLQVWCNLAWFGSALPERFPELLELRRKGSGFSETEKLHVLALQGQAIGDLQGLYRRLPEVSATPYYHPILPLLIHTAHARRAMPEVPDPGFSHPEDALWQLREGRRRVSEWYGRPVTGLWPSEGSVSPELLPLVKEAGFTWMASDQGVLERSERDPGDHHAVWEQHGLRLVFRDRDASDRVGFVYASWEGRAAAEDLHRRLGERPSLIALDGENPWETYRDGGGGLLGALLRRPGLVTVAELAASAPRKLSRLFTGSWIGANFRIWIGHPEDRAAWRVLAEVRGAWEEAGRPEAARHAMMAAEGSDWFWWYGDEFSTPFAGEFDRLFRAHLTAVCRVIGMEPPEALKRPIKAAEVRVTPPRHALPPGGLDDWYSWAGAGRVALRAGAMAPLAGVPAALRFGWREGVLHLQLEPASPGWRAEIDGKHRDFERDGATFRSAPAVPAVVLWGPHGQRLPEQGSFELPSGLTVARPQV